MDFVPVAAEAEVLLLRWIMNNPDQLRQVDLEPESFFFPGHQIIFRGMKTLQRENLLPTEASLLHILNRDGMLDAAGGRGYIGKVKSGPAGSQEEFRGALEMLRKVSLSRSYWHLADNIKSMASKTDDPVKLADLILQQIRSIHGASSNGSVMTWDQTWDYREEMTQKRLEEHVAGTTVKIDWPWRSWNKIIRPMRQGTLGLVVGLSGLGKTLLATHLAEHWARSGLQVAFFHYELDHSLMLDRQESALSGVPLENIEDGTTTPEHIVALTEARAQMRQWPGAIHYIHSPLWSAVKVANHIRDMIDLGMCDVFIVDYLQKIPFAPGPGMTTAQRVGQNVEELKSAAEQQPGTCGILLSQFNTKVEVVNSIHDLRGDMIRNSGEPIEKSNLVILLHAKRLKDAYVNQEGRTIADVGEYDPVVDFFLYKQTRGKQGMGQNFYDRERGKIMDLVW